MKTISCDHCGSEILKDVPKHYEEIGINENASWSHFGKTVLTFKIEFLRTDDDPPDLCDECFRRDAMEQFERIMNPPKVAPISDDEDIRF